MLTIASIVGGSNSAHAATPPAPEPCEAKIKVTLPIPRPADQILTVHIQGKEDVKIPAHLIDPVEMDAITTDYKTQFAAQCGRHFNEKKDDKKPLVALHEEFIRTRIRAAGQNTIDPATEKFVKASASALTDDRAIGPGAPASLRTINDAGVYVGCVITGPDHRKFSIEDMLRGIAGAEGVNQFGNAPGIMDYYVFYFLAHEIDHCGLLDEVGSDWLAVQELIDKYGMEAVRETVLAIADARLVAGFAKGEIEKGNKEKLFNNLYGFNPYIAIQNVLNPNKKLSLIDAKQFENFIRKVRSTELLSLNSGLGFFKINLQKLKMQFGTQPQFLYILEELEHAMERRWKPYSTQQHKNKPEQSGRLFVDPFQEGRVSLLNRPADNARSVVGMQFNDPRLELVK